MNRRHSIFRPIPLLTLALVVVMPILVAVRLNDPRVAEPGSTPSQTQMQAPAAQAVRSAHAWGAAVGFASHGRLVEHYEKHGAEFGAIPIEEYLRRAQALRDAAPRPSILEAVREDGVTTRFDRNSGAFIAFTRAGIIKTFFRPNDGERYFQRQRDRDA